MKYFHFTLGPVQGFVSQSRRTRDFWAGSFLLSYLSARAMENVEDQGGTIVMPEVVRDEMLKRLHTGAGAGPDIGSLPNCFTAEVREGFDGGKVGVALQKAWKDIAEAVWKKDNLQAAGADKTLWDTQIENFWEIAWAIAPPHVENALAMRKNWRDHYPPEQAGDKCTMMGEWQELSGVVSLNRALQGQFWAGVRTQIGNHTLDLREGERLCAIAYVKRRFVHVWSVLNPGWILPTGVPSTAYMAALHWLKRLIQSAPNPEAIRALWVAAKAANSLGESKTRITCISKALETDSAVPKEIADIDGRLLFENELRQLSTAQSPKAGEISPDQAQKIRESRNTVLASAKTNDADLPSEPAPFYAVLLMDGDSLGKTKKAMGNNAKQLSKALATFTDQVPKKVMEHSGFLVYAGGDDVLALLSLEDALGCALALRQAYMNVFAQADVPAESYSISAGLIYAHMKLPLTLVLKDAHSLLDDVAKTQTGRDAIAVRVWKPGGAQLTWSTHWGIDGSHVHKLRTLTEDFQKNENEEAGQASKPLFRIRERLQMLAGGSNFTKEQITQLLVAEYLSTGVLRDVKEKHEIAKTRIDDLLPLCKKADDTYGAEAAMLLRFLAQKGVHQ